MPRYIRESQVAACRTQSRDPDHWRDDGTCKHQRPRVGASAKPLVDSIDEDGDGWTMTTMTMFCADDFYDQMFLGEDEL